MRIFTLAILFSIQQLFAQFPNVPIDYLSSTERPCEPSIAISPVNPDIVVAGAILNKVYFSIDGGKTWKRQGMESTYGVYGDPNILATQDGQFYYFHLADPDKKGHGSPNFLDRIVCQTSTDSGRTWSSGSSIGKNSPKVQDKEWSAEDPRTGRVYVSWTQFDKYNSPDPKDKSNIMISWSDDKGASWSDATRINKKSGDCLDDDKTTEGAVPAVGPDGEVYVAWAWKNKIYFDRSEDAGKTWLKKDIKVAKQPGGWTQDIPGIYRCNGMPITLCDNSEGPNKGTIYICWSDTRSGKDDVDIWSCYSTDKGDSWSDPVRVNDDGPGAMQFFPWMTIDPSTGYLYCVYYDRRSGKGLETEVYVAYSVDGGRSFSNVKISEKPFTPNPRVFFGDYNDISAEQGNIRPIWTRMSPKGRTSVWTAIISHESLLNASPK